tara:strand:+ start:812 stop:4105 length:3294 start_codon:yes stop_codon:yes gene_type:complete
MKSMSFRWDIINAHARDISLTQQAIHSFDDFIARSVPEIIKSNNTIEVSSQLVNNGPKRSVVFSNPTYKNPSVVEKNQDVRALTPFEARTRDLTFSAPMYVDISYKETPKAKVEVHKQIYIGRMPVMVKSSMDNCSIAYTECEHDPGGYMIINGNEKVVIVQQRVIPNLILCFSHHNNYQSIVHSCSNKWTNAYCALKIQGNSLIPARVDISGITSSIPVITFLSALGWPVSNIKNRLRLNEEEWDLWYKDTGFKTINTKTSMAFVLNRMKNKKNPKRSFLYLCYPHVGRDVDFDVLVSNKWPKRKEIAIQQTISLIKTFRGQRKCDSRDQLINKRLDTAGVMMTSLFALIWNKYMEEIEKMIQKCCDKNKKVRIEKLISTTTITDGMKYALATGNWKSKDMTSSRVGVSQSLSRNTFISCISQLRRVDSNIEAEQKMINPRKLYGDVWGFLCPNETPEGSPTGLVYQMGITAQISTESHNQRLFSTITFDPNGKTTVFHNGIPVGNVKDAIQTCQNIKMLRRNRLIALDVSVSYVNEAIHVWSDTGRIYRPVFVVENGKLNITNDILDDLKKGRTLFNDLYQLGIVENIDSFETSNCYIALNPEDITPQHTHCELHPSMIFGTLVSSSPFADMNPGPRNTYQAAMGKQAMGIYISTYQKRFDTTGLILNYVQKPLAITKSAKTLKQNEMPAGFNAIVACMCDEGYNQEDSTQWNKASIERGMGRSTTYQTVTASTVTRGSGYHQFKRPKRNETKNMRDDRLYSCLDDDGLPPPGTSITAGQVAIGRTTMPKDALVHKNDLSTANVVKARDASIFHKKSSGVVDDTIVFQNDQGGQTAKVKIRVQKIPELGDKFSSRHAQKGTIGMIYQQQDLPFTQDGITPDIIINPHCMPSRMTVGHFTEQLASKVAAITGRQVDATSFAHAPVDTFCNELKAAGFQPYGNEQLYSGRTGLPLKAKVFIGPLYYQKLKHMSSDKLHARPRGKIVGLTRQPNEGRVNGGGLRWGEMERDVGISYGASKVLNERMLISSDLYEAPVCDKCGFIGLKRKVTGRAYVCSGCSGEIKTVKMPYASKLLMQELMSMGIATRLKTEEVKENI